MIAFVGSVFSPYYASARRGGNGNPYNYCALNVALYGRNCARWTMTERGEKRLRRSASVLSIGPSHLRWTGSSLEIQIDERCAPLPRRVRGKIRLFPSHFNDRSFALDPAGRHQWTPYAPCSRVEVELSQPALSWSGNGYFDANFGAASLETDFKKWTWSRASAPHGTTVLYDVTGRDATPHSLALRFSDVGRIETIEPPPMIPLPNSKWGVKRQTRADFGCEPRILKSLEDAPFYSRTLLDTSVLGIRAAAVHESLDLDRFNSRWVQYLLPFRMPRLAL